MKSSRRVLYNSAEVRSAIIDLFRAGGTNRIAISAFVGDGAEAYLPCPKDLRLICSPTPGATNPSTLRLLMSKGVTVEFVDGLHMKIYWVENRGAVVTSANLSTNAMGVGGLKEAGVFLPPNEIDIERVLKQLKPRPAKPELRRLDFKHRAYCKRVPWAGTKRKSSYIEWFESPVREQWKFFTYSTVSLNLSDTAVHSVRQEFGKKPHDWMWSELPRVRKDEWVLCLYATSKRLRGIHWLFADRVIAVPRSDRNFDPEYPYEVIQIHRAKQYPPPPFSIDRQFREATKRVLLPSHFHDADSPYVLRAGILRALYSAMS